MSIIDNILVTIDDEDRSKASLEAFFPHTSVSLLYSAIGRLIGKKLIKEKGKGKDKVLTITDDGGEIVETGLDYLSNLTKDEKLSWILVSTSITEKYKVERERIRLALKDLGFGLVKNGLYIGQIKSISEFKKVIDEKKSNSSIHIFEISKPAADIIDSPENFWDTNKIKKQYLDWSVKVQKFIKNLPKDSEMRRVTAKSIVYELALITKNDPKIVNDKFSNSIGRSQAIKLYKEIRDYCYR